jgi:hypothetical protein
MDLKQILQKFNTHLFYEYFSILLRTLISWVNIERKAQIILNYIGKVSKKLR